MPVHYAKGVPLKGYESTRSLRYPNQATFHPTKYLRGLVRCIKERNGRLFADTAVMSVEEEDGGIVIKTEGGQTVRAKNAVVATNSPINDRVALHSKQAPYRTYVMALQLPRGKLPDALYWDTLDPYHYVRLQPGKDLTISSSAAPTTRAAKRTMRRFVTRRSKRGYATSCRTSATSPTAGRDRCSTRSITRRSADATPAARTCMCTPATPARA